MSLSRYDYNLSVSYIPFALTIRGWARCLLGNQWKLFLQCLFLKISDTELERHRIRK